MVMSEGKAACGSGEFWTGVGRAAAAGIGDGWGKDPADRFVGSGAGLGVFRGPLFPDDSESSCLILDPWFAFAPSSSLVVAPRAPGFGFFLGAVGSGVGVGVGD